MTERAKIQRMQLLHAADTYVPIAIIALLALFAVMLGVLYRRARR